MTTAGPNMAGTGANDATVGTVAWTNTGNITSEDGVVASVSNGSSTQYLVATNFGFSIPSGATINGITAEIRRKRGGINTCLDAQINIVKGGVIKTTNKSTGTVLPTSFAYKSYGGSSDLWGESWTYSDINSSGFGFVYRVDRGGGKSAMNPQVDAMRITIDYTDSASGPVNMKTVVGLAKASVKTVDGLAIASVKTINGLA